MEEMYKKSIQAIQDLDKRPLKKEWNTIANEFGFLNSIVLSRISGKSFTQLCIEVRRKDK